MTSNRPSPFEEAIGRFTEGLRRRDVEDIRVTTLKHLKASIANLQARQHSQRRLQNLNRLEPFLEAIEQYGKVVSSLYGDINIVAFVWVGYSIINVVGLSSSCLGTSQVSSPGRCLRTLPYLGD